MSAILKRRRFLSSLTAAGIAGVSGCTGSLTGGTQEEVTLVANMPQPADTTPGPFLQRVAETVSQETDGRFTIEIHYNGELGGHVESLEGVSQGTMDLYPSTYPLIIQYPPIAVLGAPYLYDSLEDALEKSDYRNNDAVNELKNELIEETNIRPLPPTPVGTRRLTLKSEPAYKPSDLNGKRVRFPATDLYRATVEGLGATPVDVPFGELPTALATGSLDGQENPYGTIWGVQGIWENQNYVMETNHIYVIDPVLINEDSWQDLPEDYQTIFIDAIDASRQQALEDVKAQVSEVKSNLRDEGLTIVEPDELDMAAFKQGARSSVRETFPDQADRLDAILGSRYG